MKEEVLNFIKSYFQTYFVERDLEKSIKFFSNKASGIGTGLNEINDNSDDFIQLFKRDLEEIKFPIKCKDLSFIVNFLSTDACIVSGRFSLEGKADNIPFFIPENRYTFVLTKENDLWKIVHFHFSIPFIHQEENESFPLLELKRKNELLNRKVEERTYELREANKKLIKSNASKEMMLSVIGHDIRSPFSSLLGFISLLKENYDYFDDSKKKEFINIINKSADKIFSLVDNLLIWSKTQIESLELHPKPINLHEIVEESFALYKEIYKKKGVKFISDIDEVVQVMSDKIMLSIIMRNLLSNAVKFTNLDGEIIVWTEEVKNSNEITVNVKDTGVGMSEDKLNKLFFSEINESLLGTNMEQGTGMGLSLCKKLIDLHHSKLHIESKEGAGTKIFFNLQKA
jgi:signal transduction histidine kinase